MRFFQNVVLFHCTYFPFVVYDMGIYTNQTGSKPGLNQINQINQHPDTPSWKNRNSARFEKNLVKPRNNWPPCSACRWKPYTATNRGGVRFQLISSDSCSSWWSNSGVTIVSSSPAGTKKNVARKRSVRPGNSKVVISAGSCAAHSATVPPILHTRKK